MKTGRAIIGALVPFLFLLCLMSQASAMEARLIDKSNCEEIKNFVPKPVFEWLKKGDFIMNVHEKFDYEVGDNLPQWALESRTENVGKYKLNDQDVIVDAKTGEYPGFIKGIPFPDIDEKDPKGAVKIIYNSQFLRDNNGPLRTRFAFPSLGRKTGLERKLFIHWWSYPLAGWGPAANLPNPDQIEANNQILIVEPYDMAGTAMMTWRYLTEKPDMLYGFIPAIRRVRRMTPAGRSDAMFGTDFARDDGSYSGYDGRIPEAEWKIIGKTEIYGAFLTDSSMPISINKDGEWAVDVTDRNKYERWGYDDPQWKGKVAPWCTTSACWLKRPVWIVEGKHKDPYYNYGRQIHYIDAELFCYYWKEIYDRAGNYWKMTWPTWGFFYTPDKKIRGNAVVTATLLDERLQHATAYDGVGPGCEYNCNAKQSIDQYSLTGFVEMCK